MKRAVKKKMMIKYCPLNKILTKCMLKNSFACGPLFFVRTYILCTNNDEILMWVYKKLEESVIYFRKTSQLLNIDILLSTIIYFILYSYIFYLNHMIKQYKKRTHTTYGIVNKRRANKKKKK